jgi:hypothetical protein
LGLRRAIQDPEPGGHLAQLLELRDAGLQLGDPREDSLLEVLEVFDDG